MSEAAGIYTRESDYLDRCVQVGVAGDRVLSVSFPASLAADADPDHPLLDRLFEYLAGAPDEFDDIELALTVPTDQRAVLDAVRELAYGDQTTVEQLARRIPTLDADADDDRDSVRTALDENPIPIIIPDHRVRDGPSAAPPKVEQKLRSLEGL
ncbi:MGMT family protein [Halococcus thailandensis]|uniref:Methylated-DNA--protein-cysteine methyltransferase n=1 Tax=Halococcus thailandensis JCM 13552 TaxID=1227457 RepID=M0N7A8_9EURY|nr:MGMT family protein [Halococcus thailandensis]EMA53761.1 methylated-DNA--protein-cysteine methyltransferase [Halococcus thailandensis JCM 13552]